MKKLLKKSKSDNSDISLKLTASEIDEIVGPVKEKSGISEVDEAYAKAREARAYHHFIFNKVEEGHNSSTFSALLGPADDKWVEYALELKDLIYSPKYKDVDFPDDYYSEALNWDTEEF